MKRYLSVLMVLVLFFAFLFYGIDNRNVQAEGEQKTIIYGDLNQDGNVGLDDVQMALKAALKIMELPKTAMAAMDVDNNDSLDLSDVTIILQRALRIIDHFPGEEISEPTEKPDETVKPITTNVPLPSEPVVKEGKTLIVYFSWSSNTEKMAKTIQEQTNGTLFEIVPQNPYPEDYTKCTEVALEERDSNARPEIQNLPVSIEEYDKILIGYPIWWHTAPMIIGTFLEHYDLTGIDIYPFTQSASMNREQFENSMEFVRGCVGGGTVHDGLFARYSDTNAIISYLNNNNLTE